MRWDPTINMGHVITMATSLVSSLIFVMVAWSAVDKRITVLEENRTYQNQLMHERQDQVNEKIGDVKTSITELKTSVENLRRDIQTNRK